VRIAGIEAIPIDIPLAIKDGLMDVPTGPGFGLILDDSLLRRHRVA
jgi:L-alanine-DL-glutamate epimerase-like enolase superfamily enzyme